jgi:3-hydroxyacyl-[acyl-carrier-protein] dehydratase
MRWFLVDRFTELISGTRATALKSVSLGEEHLVDHFPGYAAFPNSLIIEGMAQTGGLLVSEHNDFQERVILAKIARSVFHFCARPGDTLTYRATIEQIRRDGAIVVTTSHVEERLQGEAEIFFAHLNEDRNSQPLFEPLDLLVWLNLLGVFRVGQKPDGTPIRVPAQLARAEEELARSEAELPAGGKY